MKENINYTYDHDREMEQINSVHYELRIKYLDNIYINYINDTKELTNIERDFLNMLLNQLIEVHYFIALCKSKETELVVEYKDHKVVRERIN